MATLRSTLEQVKRQFHEFLPPAMILHACPEHPYRFRQRLPLKIYQAVVRRLSGGFGAEVQAERWNGRRVVLVDGSTCSMPDTPELQTHFGHPPG